MINSEIDDLVLDAIRKGARTAAAINAAVSTPLHPLNFRRVDAAMQRSRRREKICYYRRFWYIVGSTVDGVIVGGGGNGGG